MSEEAAGGRCSPCRSTEPRRRTVTLIDPFITPTLPGLASTLGALDATATADDSVSVMVLLLAAAAIAAVGALGVFAPWLMPKREDSALVACGNSFAGGVLLAAGLIHLLGDADAGFQSAYPDLDYPAAYAIATAAFLAVLESVFVDVQAEVVTFDNPYTGQKARCTIYSGRRHLYGGV